MSRRTTLPAAWMTERNLARGRQLWDDGMSATDIACVLGKGCTKSALLGKAHRLGWPPRLSPVGPNAGTVVPRKPEQPHRSRALPPTRRLPAKTEVRHEACRPQPLAVPTAAFLGCQWPMGDPKERGFRLCGVSPAADGRPYCAEHMRIAYVSRSPRRSWRHDRRALRAARWRL